MTGAAPMRVGWCPGALRPMQAGDGLIVRVKPRGGGLSFHQARGVAEWAERAGNGILNLTARANLQIRGVSEVTLPALTEALDGLGLLDASAEIEAVRNIVANPLAGHDESALLDGRRIVESLERAIGDDPVFRRLPAKFAWVIDEGGALPLDDVAADIRFTAMRLSGRIVFAVGLAAHRAAALCQPAEVPHAAGRLAAAFLDLCDERGLVPHRMRDLLAVAAPSELVQAAGLHSPLAAAAGPPRSRVEPIGLQAAGQNTWLGVAPPFGRFRSRDLAMLAKAAQEAGATALRPTPWRSFLIAGLRTGAGEPLRAAIERNATLILDAGDPRLRVAACAGAPACHRATTDVQAHATRLAASLDRSVGRRTHIHVSGCGKGCAHPEPADLTLVGRDGAYDLVRAGSASGLPTEFGLSIGAVAAMVARLHLESAC